MKQKGFTLIEVVIAVFILALMSVMIWQITNNAYRGANKSKDYDSVYQNARVALKKLVDDISMAFLIAPTMQGKAPDGTTLVETSFIGNDNGEEDELNFNSFSNIRLIKNEKKADQIEVGYSVENCPEPNEKKKCLMRRESAVLDKEIKEGGKILALAKVVKKFNLEYYDPNKQEWRGDWSSKDPVFQNKLPTAARITLVFEDPRNETLELPFTTEVVLPLSTGMIDF